MSMKLRNITIIILLHLLMLFSCLAKAQQISYIQPDIGAPGLHMYVEIFANVNQINAFGNDGFYLNNENDEVRIVHVNPQDSLKVVFGPIVVSWDGRLISSTFFIAPELKPNSHYQENLQSEFIIPFRIMVNGQVGNSTNFYIVKPFPALHSSEPGILGSGGIWGKRSKRGAMIFEHIELIGNHVYTISTLDTDSDKPGNQGFLPAQIYSLGSIQLKNGAKISVDGNLQHAGPGGGGGGGAFFQQVGVSVPGGNGFTGGQMRNSPGIGSGALGMGNNGGMSLNGLEGGKGGASGTAGTGGGTGFAFGSSGQGAIPSQCNVLNMPSNKGGGSGANKCGNIGYGGAGGGFGSDGHSQTSGQGIKNGNRFLVPLSGGSGGAGGNPVNGQAGFGGGGGGALHLSALNEIVLSEIHANGAKGGNTGPQTEGFFSGAGGGGSGGGVIVSSKMYSRIVSIHLQGGDAGQANPLQSDLQHGGKGGAGRIRINGKDSVIANLQPLNASQYLGHSTDTISVVLERSFTLSGYGNGNPIDVYLKPQSGKWHLVQTITNYNKRFNCDIELQCEDTIFYISTAQRTAEESNNPIAIFSQSGSNRIFAHAPPTEVPVYSNSPLCLGLNLQLSAYYESPFYKWTGPQGFESDQATVWIENVNGNHQGRYYLEALVHGCEVEKGFVDVEVNLPPEITLGKDTTVCPTMGFLVSPGFDFMNYVWQDSSTYAIYRIDQEGHYWVEITDIFGCKANAELTVESYCDPRIWIPNSFTPNNDGINDEFGPEGSYIGIMKMRIFNRWGALIYEEEKERPRWNGKIGNNNCQQDIYLYEIFYTDKLEGKKIDFKGKVMLLR